MEHMPRTYITASRATCLLMLILSAAPAASASNPAVSVQVSWIDWPNKDARKQEADNSEHYQDSKLEASLVRTMIKTLLEADIRTRSNADLIVQINVTGTTIDRRYNDSLFGTVNNRPTEYAGRYTVKVHRGGETVSRHSDKFSFKSSYGSGQTSTKMSKIKVTGLINDWLANYIEKRKFRKALSVPPLSNLHRKSKPASPSQNVHSNRIPPLAGFLQNLRY